MTMPFEKKAEEMKPANTVRMKYTGIFKGPQKIVELPIPLISNSQKLDEHLKFTREGTKGPAFCDVPIKWAGALIAVGGRWQVAEPLTPEMLTKIAAAKEACDAEMRKFAEDNELVEA